MLVRSKLSPFCSAITKTSNQKSGLGNGWLREEIEICWLWLPSKPRCRCRWSSKCRPNAPSKTYIFTRFTSAYRSHELGKTHTVNFSGNHKKALNLSVAASLKKLQTSYIDLLYLHWWVGRLRKEWFSFLHFISLTAFRIGRRPSKSLWIACTC